MHRLFNNLWAIALIVSVSVSAQETPYSFQKLNPTDTISNAEYEQLFGTKDTRTAFLISKWKSENHQEKLALFKKNGDSWTIFWLFEQQTTEHVKLTEDEKFMTYITSAKTSGEGFSKSRFYFCIVDLQHEKQMPILQQYNDETWEIAQSGKSDPVSQLGCSTQIVWLGKGNLTSIYTATKDFTPPAAADDCLPRGQYKIQNDKLVKIK